MRKDILICRCLEFFALQKIGMTIKGLSYSCLTRVFMDPRNKSEDDERVCAPEDDYSKKMSPRVIEKREVSEDDYKKCVSEDCAS